LRVIIQTENVPDPIILKFKLVQGEYTLEICLPHRTALIENPGSKCLQLRGFPRLWALPEHV